jgi:ribosomal-protein-alanine N-acetyltransferase
VSTETAALHPVIRFLTLSDLDRVMEIELAAYPFPWTRGIFEDCIRVGYDCRGLQLGSVLVGYAVHTLFAAECHLLNLCVDPMWQRRRLGSLLLEQTIHQAGISNCSSVFLEVRPSNRAGMALYRKRGFYIVGERPDYYRAEHGRESAIVMRLDLDELPAEPFVVRHNPF